MSNARIADWCHSVILKGNPFEFPEFREKEDRRGKSDHVDCRVPKVQKVIQVLQKE